MNGIRAYVRVWDVAILGEARTTGISPDSCFNDGHGKV